MHTLSLPLGVDDEEEIVRRAMRHLNARARAGGLRDADQPGSTTVALDDGGASGRVDLTNTNGPIAALVFTAKAGARGVRLTFADAPEAVATENARAEVEYHARIDAEYHDRMEAAYRARMGAA